MAGTNCLLNGTKTAEVCIYYWNWTRPNWSHFETASFRLRGRNG